MKRILQSITFILAVCMLSSNMILAQQVTTGEKEKQKEAELAQKKADEMKKQEQMKKADELKKQEEIMKKVQVEMELKNAKSELEGRDYERAVRDYEIIRQRAEDMSQKALFVVPEEGVWNIRTPDLGNYYFYDQYHASDKPGSSWNYSRQVLEATFTNEFSMGTGGEDGVATLTVSGNCAEGAITVAIIMPDGKQLSEVVIDANGSLNWRKTFEEDEGNGWKNGKWVFKIKAKEATGNFRISMTTN